MPPDARSSNSSPLSESADDLETSPAYEEGWSAYQRDLDRDDNPYEAEQAPAKWRDWRHGWMDALEEAEAIDR
jgi:hypothetical protein